MKIAINCAFYQPQGGGIKEYIENLVVNLAKYSEGNEIILYVLKDQMDYAKKSFPDIFRLKSIPYNSGSKFNRIKRSLLENRFWRKEEVIEKFDLFHSPFFHAPELKQTPVLLTVHDLRLYRLPKTYEFFRYRFLKIKVKSSIERARHIISVSDFTKKEILDVCGVKDNKVTTIHEAINFNTFSSQREGINPGLPEEVRRNGFLLSVGHIEPRKNYDRLIDAFEILKKDPEFDKLSLVIVGKKDHTYKDTMKKIEDTPGVIHFPHLNHDKLIWLYRHALLFVFPSYYEGFGFPPLEAACFGTVSAVSNAASIPEVCGEGAFYFNPFDIEGMSQTIKLALQDKEEAKKKKEHLKRQLQKFSWENNIKSTLQVYYQI